MSNLVAGIGEYKVSNRQDDVIKTFALGSCVAVVMYDRVNHVAGLLHVALPDSSISAEKANNLPGYFADTGLPVLLKEMKRLGMVQKFTSVKLAGGASVLDENNRFDIGKRNVLAIKKILWRFNMGITAEDVGGKMARTVYINVEDGELLLTSSGKKWKI